MCGEIMSWLEKLWEAIRRWFDKDEPDEPNNPNDQLTDAIDPKDITWLGVNVGEWEKKYPLKVKLDNKFITYDQEGTSKWTPKVFGASAEEVDVEDVALMNILEEDEKIRAMLEDNVLDSIGARSFLEPDLRIQGTALVGNPWIIAKLNGKWTAATHEWMRPKQKQKGRRSVHGDHIKRREFGPDWTPTVGEQYGFCVSGLCRDATRNEQERTQIVLFTWK